MHSQTGELIYEKVDAGNLPLLLEIYQTVWSRKTPDSGISEKPLYPEDDTNVSWLIRRGDDIVGIVGVYSYDPDLNASDFGVEPITDFQQRAADFLASLREKHSPNENILIVTSNGLMKRLASVIDQIPAEEVPNFQNGQVYLYNLLASSPTLYV